MVEVVGMTDNPSALERLLKATAHNTDCPALPYYKEATKLCNCKTQTEIADAHAEARTVLKERSRDAGDKV